MYRVSVYQDFPRSDAVESHQKVSQCTFSRTAPSNDENRLPCREVETGAFEDRLTGSRRVGKRDLAFINKSCVEEVFYIHL